MRNLRTLIIVFIATFAIAACGGRKAVDENISVESVDGTLGDGSGSGSSGLAGDGSLDGTGLAGNASLLNSSVIYFEYDSSALTFESEAIVQAHAQHLSNSSGISVILEGHADERGTREYNLALGEDRAKTVANLMHAMGVSVGGIQTISYGEERPVSLGSDETAWGLNRRVEILYQ